MRRITRTAAAALAAAIFLGSMAAGCGRSEIQSSSQKALTDKESASQESAEEGLTAETAALEGNASEQAAAAESTSEQGSAQGLTAETAAVEKAAAAGSTSEQAAAAESSSEQEAAEGLTSETAAAEEAAAEGDTSMEAAAEDAGAPQLDFDGESDLEFNARQILASDADMTKEGALGIAAYLWQMGFGRMSGYPVVVELNDEKILTVFDEEGLFYNIHLTPEGKIQKVEDVEGNELVALGTRAGELLIPPLTGADVVALLEEWKRHGGHSEVLSAYNEYAGDYGRSRMDSDDQWCSETVSAAYAALGLADKIGGMASNGNTYEKNARKIGAWVSSDDYIPSEGDILITHDGNGDRHTSCVVRCDGHTVYTIAGGGSSIHHGSVSVGSDRITGYVVPEW